MTRGAGRWLALGALGAAVVGLGISTSFSNKRLVEGLAAGDPASLKTFSARQDAFIFLQSEPVATRVSMAEGLADWDDPAAAKLVLALINDPDPTVRAALVESLTQIAERDSTSVAAEFGAAGAAATAALVEAAAANTEVGMHILRAALAADETSANAYLLAKRIGSDSETVLIEMLGKSNDQTRLAAADALSAVDLSPSGRTRVAEAVLNLYQNAESQGFKDRLLPILATFAPEGAWTIFRATAMDATAPSELRAVSARALAAMQDPMVAALAQDPDTQVARAAR